MNHESEKVLKKASDLCNDECEQEAEVLVKAQLAVDPNNLKLKTKLGEIQARLSKDNEAETTFRNVLNSDPNYEDAVCLLGTLLDQSFRLEESEQVYREFLQNNPSGHHALDCLCRLLLSENRIDETLELARNQVENYPDHHSAYNALTYVLHILEDEMEHELYTDKENIAIFTQYMSYLLEQLELVFKLEIHIPVTEDLRCELEDEMNRLVGEIHQLLESMDTRNITLSSEFEHRINSTLQRAKDVE